MNMNVYVFGNEDHPQDSLAYSIAEQLMKVPEITDEDKEVLRAINFKFIKPNEDLPFTDAGTVVIMDTVAGIAEVTLLSENDIDRIKSSPRNTVHDFDLAFQLKFLKKLGKLKRFTIVGLPIDGKVEFDKLSRLFTELALTIEES